jgi:hypothetical protein
MSGENMVKQQELYEKYCTGDKPLQSEFASDDADPYKHCEMYYS